MLYETERTAKDILWFLKANNFMYIRPGRAYSDGAFSGPEVVFSGEAEEHLESYLSGGCPIVLQERKHLDDIRYTGGDT
jgi:hypothetical protein